MKNGGQKREMADEVNGVTAEGIYLALSAQNEVLNKMSGYLDKLAKAEECKEEEDIKKSEELRLSQERSNLIKEITDQVTKALTGKFVTKEDSTQKTKPVKSDPKEQQTVIQASKDNPIISGTGKSVDEEKTDGKSSDESVKDDIKKEDDEKEKKDKDEKEKDEDKDEKFPEMEKARLAVEKIKKEMDDIKKSFDSKVQDAVEERFRKMGWKVEKSLSAPKRVDIGADEPMLKKGMTEEDRIEQLKKLDYKSLKRLEIQNEQDELPAEIKNLLT